MVTTWKDEEVYMHSKSRAWLTVLGACCMQFATVGFMNSFGVMEAFYIQEFLPLSSASAISWIGSIQLLLDLTLGAALGPLLDRGFHREVLVAGSVLFLFSQFMLSLAQPGHYYQVFLSQGLGMGLGIGSIYIPSFVAVSRHFRQRRALAMGWHRTVRRFFWHSCVFHRSELLAALPFIKLRCIHSHRSIVVFRLAADRQRFIALELSFCARAEHKERPA
ncbi:uncharacterized protein B0H18DRAFT_382780 [Fomitopsis serialis]|uniref:uncharacterized protein n=1 Tax=Fomitopsis serialis TaxID=139415 RepID=UPI0020079C71|nr:uncharacterized protein B0H18DRAFT_382780 [Neoantrodia serialis]KAH9925282.1 hypothetical protein B0H18DRAFT_382780 [Neoantrodia serialis]